MIHNNDFVSYEIHFYSVTCIVRFKIYIRINTCILEQKISIDIFLNYLPLWHHKKKVQGDQKSRPLNQTEEAAA